MTEITTLIPVTVRFFAAARDAAGAESDVLRLQTGSTIADAACELSGQSERMKLVLQKCSFLCDGVAVRDRTTVLHPHQTL
ncbi:MAG: MoaD/ThiS family protein, partial [Mycobacterium sp.]